MKGEKYLTNRFIPLEISIKNYSINLNDKKISYPDCVFSKGDINLIIGKSGSGKTTFIESLLGVNKTNDIVSLNYQYLSTEKETKKVITRNLNQSLLDGIFGYCPQISSILSEDIWSNIYLGTNIHRELIRKNLFFKSLVTPDMLKEKNCQLLSGGEQKRVSILRCLLSTKEVLIFDEPTNGLNKHYRNEIIKIMKKVSNDRMVIVISHDPDFINTFKPVLIL